MSRKSNKLLQEHIRPLEDALAEFHFVETDEELYGKIMNGQVLPQHPALIEREKIVFQNRKRRLQSIATIRQKKD